MGMKRVLAALLLLTLAAPAWGQKGYQAYERGHCFTVLEEMLPPAEHGTVAMSLSSNFEPRNMEHFDAPHVRRYTRLTPRNWFSCGIASKELNGGF